MILFKPEHADLILAGRKTQTRRLGERRWNIGAIHQCATRLFDPAAVFARVRIEDVLHQGLWTMMPADVHAEGYDSMADFLAAFARIARIEEPVRLDTLVWVVKFDLVETVAA